MTFPSVRDLRRAYNDLRWMYNAALSRHAYVERDLVVSARPQFLIIDPTSICNARCVMCPVSFRAPSDHGNDLPLALFEKLLPIVSAASHVNLFATGEPTVAKHLVHFVTETSKRTNSQIWVSTNGKHLPPDVLEVLTGPRMGLQFSVDGGTREVFEPIRRGITFEQLCGSLALASDRRGSSPFPTLSFSCTMSKRNIHALLTATVAAAERSVARTPEIFPLLKKAGVVDAGGQGLFIILQGALKSLNGEPLDGAAVKTSSAHVENLQAENGWGFDIQCVIRGDDLDVQRIRQHIESVGESVLVVGDPTLVKVHAHAPTPGAILDFCVSQGIVSKVIVENMEEQFQEILRDQAKPPIAAESISGIATDGHFLVVQLSDCALSFTGHDDKSGFHGTSPRRR